MSLKINFLEKVYNDLFLFFREKFDPDLKYVKLLLDAKVNNMVSDFGLTSWTEQVDLKKKIRVMLIREYSKYKHLEDRKHKGIRLIDAAVNVERLFSLQFCSDERLFSMQEWQEARGTHSLLNEKKQGYIQQIKSAKGDAENADTIISYMNHPHLKRLARQMDEEMQKPLTIKDFAQLILQYRESIQSFLEELKVEYGSNEGMAVVMALCLNQTNPLFFNAITKVLAYCKGNGRLDYIEAAALYYKNAYCLIQQSHALSSPSHKPA